MNSPLAAWRSPSCAGMSRMFTAAAKPPAADLGGCSMFRHAVRSLIVLVLIAGAGAGAAAAQPQSKQRRLLYVVAPGIRNYLEFGGAGVLVFDIDNAHKFVKRIATPASQAAKPENIKGVCACASTRKLYFTTLTKTYCLDLVSEKTLWEKALPGGCDRPSITPDGKVLYIPSLEKDHWNVVDAANGELITDIVTKNRAHNTVVSLDGTRMYLAGISSPILPVADTRTHKIIEEVGPFGAGIRPLTVNADRSLIYVTVNELLGFEIGDLKSGKRLHRIEVQGFKQGMVKRHGCPSHGVGLTPDETEIWVCDAANQQMHVFDNRVMPPKQIVSIKLREQPGWITFTRDGQFAYPSTGDVIDVKTKKIVAQLMDEEGREVHSEKVVEVILENGEVVLVGDQFGVGRKK
jgi:DNA-binding beta-propeller fold protein YncE